MTRTTIKSIHINGWMGIETMAIRPGALTLIRGRNASGKTSVIEALKQTVGSGHDPSFIRKGTDAAIVVVELSDGASIRLRVTPKRTTRDIVVKDEKGRKFTAGADYIQAMVRALSVDPMAFLFARPADQLRAFLEAVPIRIEAANLGFLPVGALDGISLDAHGLEVIEAIDRRIRQERTDLNRDAREKAAAAKGLSETLPPESPEGTDWSTELYRLLQEIKTLQRETAENKRDIEADAHAAITGVAELYAGKRRAVEAEIAEAIEKLRADAAIEIGRQERERDAKLAEIRQSEKDSLSALEGDYTPKITKLTRDHAHAKDMVEQEAKAAKTREFIDQQEAQAEEARRKADGLSLAIEQIANLKNRLVTDLPISGMTVQDGELFLDGIPFHRVNRAQQVAVAIELAKLRAGELGFVVVDDIEHLDSASLGAFTAGARASGLQFLAAMVDDVDLEVANA